MKFKTEILQWLKEYIIIIFDILKQCRCQGENGGDIPVLKFAKGREEFTFHKYR